MNADIKMKNQMERITLEFYKDTVFDENLKAWMETPDSSEETYYECIPMRIGPFDKEQMKQIVDKEKLVPWSIQTLVHQFLCDLINEDATAMMWYHEYVSRMLKYSIEHAEEDLIKKKRLIKEILELGGEEILYNKAKSKKEEILEVMHTTELSFIKYNLQEKQ